MTDEKIIPNSNDVLMGRGGTNNKHVGNENFRILAQRRSIQYASSSKQNKTQIHASLLLDVFNMRPPGRFIRKDRKSKEWIKVDIDEALEKASRTLREAVAKHSPSTISNYPSLKQTSILDQSSNLLLAPTTTSSESSGTQRKRMQSEITPTSMMSLSTSKQQRGPSHSTSSVLSTIHPLHRHQMINKAQDHTMIRTISSTTSSSSSRPQQNETKLRPFTTRPDGEAKMDGDADVYCKEVSSWLSKQDRADHDTSSCCSESFLAAAADGGTQHGSTSTSGYAFSTTKTDQKWVEAAASLPSFTTNSLLNSFSSQQTTTTAVASRMTRDMGVVDFQKEQQQHHHHYYDVIQHQQEPITDSFSASENNKGNLLMIPPAPKSLDDIPPKKQYEIKSSSSNNLLKEEEKQQKEERVTINVAAAASSSLGGNDACALSLDEEDDEQQGLDPRTYSTLMEIFSDDKESNTTSAE